jgi:hypothetical protein
METPEQPVAEPEPVVGEDAEPAEDDTNGDAETTEAETTEE